MKTIGRAQHTTYVISKKLKDSVFDTSKIVGVCDTRGLSEYVIVAVVTYKIDC